MLYEQIDASTSRHYNAYMSAGPGDAAARALGFVMTVYRRRLTSSFFAIRESLSRRLKTLEESKPWALATLLDADDRRATEEEEGVPDAVPAHVSTELLSD